MSGIACAMEAGESDDLIECCKTASRERIVELVSRLAEEMQARLPDQRLVLNWEEIEEMSADPLSSVLADFTKLNSKV